MPSPTGYGTAMAAPRHIAVIPDGNRRWARSRGLEPVAGHAAGINAMTAVIEAAWAAGVETFTFWWGSPANLTTRAPEEVAGIIAALSGWLTRSAPALLAAHDAQLSVLGRWPALCPSLIEPVQRAAASAGQGPRRLVVLMGYDGREEILAAAAAAGGDRQAFQAALWTGGLPPVDLVVRTGGEPHLSAGFLLWWIAEARLVFSSVLWPAFTPANLRSSLVEFGAAERRFGR